MSRVTALTPVQAHAIGMIGQPVTYQGEQHTLRSVEGGDWYAHLNSEGLIVIDTDLSGGQWITEPIANILPAGCEFGRGFQRSVPLAWIKRGVSLMKSYA